MRQLVALAVFLVVLCIVLAVAGAVLKFRFGARGGGRLPYRRKDYLLSAAERSFYEVLRVGLGGEARLVIFPKVRLFDLFWLPKGTRDAQVHRNRVMCKHVDFVVCDRQDLRPLLVIELDDASHGRADRHERDTFVDRVMSDAGLPILHMPCRRNYSTREVAQQVHAAITGNPDRSSA